MVCGGASIEADEDSAGHSITEDPYLIADVWDRCGRYRDMASVFRGRILTFMAGAEAEAELLGHEAEGDGDDRLQVALMLNALRIPEGETDRAERRFREKARTLVRRHRSMIEQVAGALEAERSLTAEEIDALVGQPLWVPLAEWWGGPATDGEPVISLARATETG